MASRGLPPRTVAALYAAAGVLFVVGAFSSVGVAFIVLAALIYLRRPGKD